MQDTLFNTTPYEQPPKKNEPVTINLYPHQNDFVNKIRQLILEGHTRIVGQAPTGFGKTVVAAYIAQSGAGKQNQVLFNVAGRNLVNQTAASFRKFGIETGVIMAGVPTNRNALVQVSSVDTLNSRLGHGHYDWLNPEIIVTDEAHESVSARFDYIRETWPNAIELLLTATPSRADGQGLGRVATAMVESPPYQELIDKGYLVQPRWFSVQEVDSQYLKMAGGEFTHRSSEEAYQRIVLVGGIIKHWKRYAQDRPTVVFASSVAHAIMICEQFNKEGIPAAHVDADTPDVVRQKHYKDLSEGRIKVITNYGVLGRGWDVTAVSCVQLVREFGFMGNYIQAVGRGLRAHPGKKDCIILDHGENFWRHGDFVVDPVEWSLADGKVIKEEREELRKERKKSEVHCQACHMVYTGKSCPNCGWTPPPKTREQIEVETREAILAEVKAAPKERASRDTEADKARVLGEFIWHANNKNYKPGFAFMSYRDYYGVDPTVRIREMAKPNPPSATTARWLSNRNRAFHARNRAIRRKQGKPSWRS